MSRPLFCCCRSLFPSGATEERILRLLKGLWSSVNTWLAAFVFASFFFSVVGKVRDLAARKLNRGRKRNDREGGEGRSK